MRVSTGLNGFVVPVSGEEEDFIGADEDSAVFMKIKVKREDLEEALTNFFSKIRLTSDAAKEWVDKQEWVNGILERAYQEPVAA